MADRDLNLNSLARYAKQSPDLVLEERSHCEIPAGCGGVVLRWWNPKQGIPVAIWVHSQAGREMWLDGRPVSYGVPLVTFGSHVLTFAITRLQPGQVALMVAAFREANDRSGAALPEPDPRRVVALSLPDGSWKYSRVAPIGDAWTRSDFDDSGWDAMELGTMPAGDGTSFSGAARLGELGARGLAVSGAGSEIWVRKVFELSERASPASPEGRT
jgi:hypothetical protein